MTPEVAPDKRSPAILKRQFQPSQIEHLSNDTGLEVGLVPHGAAIQAIRVPVGDDKVNVVLGYDDPQRYVLEPYFLGKTIGRYAGRIRRGRFDLSGRSVTLATDSDGAGHCLHGGPRGLYTRTWQTVEREDDRSVRFYCRSGAGDQGFPGAVRLEVVYTLVDTTLAIEFSARTSADTILNLTNHAYFNLAGTGGIEGHRVQIAADSYTPVDDEWIPTGEIVPVAGTRMDFRAETDLGTRLGDTGFDTNFVLNHNRVTTCPASGTTVAFAASAVSRETGIRLNIYTTQPGLQFYTGQYLATPFAPFQGLCLEAQAFPDSPNHEDFPSTEVLAGQPYRQTIVYEFDVAGANP